MLISALALMGFLAPVAFYASRTGVVAVSCIVGVIVSLQFLVYGVRWCAEQVAMGGSASRRGVVRVVMSVTG